MDTCKIFEKQNLQKKGSQEIWIYFLSCSKITCSCWVYFMQDFTTEMWIYSWFLGGRFVNGIKMDWSSCWWMLYLMLLKKKYPHLLRWFYDFPHSINVHFHHFHHFHHVHIQSMFNYSNIIVTRFPWNHYFPNDLFHGFSHDILRILRSKRSEMKTLATRSAAKDKSSGTPPLPMD